MREDISKRVRNALMSDKFVLFHSIVQIITMFSWLLLLTYTTAYYVIYLMIGLCGFLCRFIDGKDTKCVFTKAKRSDLLISSVFSLTIIAANHDIFPAIVNKLIGALSSHSAFTSAINNSQLDLYAAGLFALCFPVFFLGGLYCAFFILQSIEKRVLPFQFAPYERHAAPKKVFLTAFAAFCVFYAAILLLGFYPGVIPYDAVDQLSQIHLDQYSNRHPFYYTMVIRVFIRIGTLVFNDITFGAALYCFFSIVFLSSVFAYSAVTLYQINIHKNIVATVVLIYFLMPHHIMFSFTMWKDTPFSGCILLFIVSLFRYIEGVGKNRTRNALLSIVSGVGICVFRGNGLIVFFIIIITFVLLFRKKHTGFCVAFSCVLAFVLIMTYPVLNSFHIEQSDTVELISVPLQQVSRTVVENDDLTDRQKELIGKVADIDAIAGNYTPYISDPIKNLIRESGDQNYLTEHKLLYASLYFELGITHPKSYFLAWVDETKGYWNAGYNYWRYYYFCFENDLGVERTVVSKPLQKAVGGYCSLFEYVSILQPFVSIGLHTWLILLLALIGYRKKDKLTVFLTVPCLAVIFTLLIGTPVFAEFRYAYSLFCCLPFLAVITFRGKSSGNTDNPPLAKAIMDGDTTHEH